MFGMRNPTIKKSYKICIGLWFPLGFWEHFSRWNLNGSNPIQNHYIQKSNSQTHSSIELRQNFQLSKNQIVKNTSIELRSNEQI